MGQQWQTPSRGKFSTKQMCESIIKFMEEDKEAEYTISVGTDSQQFFNNFKFVTAVAVHRVHKGGQYYYTIENTTYINSLKQKIMYEAALTSQYKEILTDELTEVLIEKGIEIIPDSDIGEDGKTKQFIPEVRGMFRSQGGHDVRIKPYSTTASSIANKHSK
jgi:predicted RNase H-related nuclease YkuK (DUF458 family)